MFRIYMHALRFTHIQRKTKCILQTTHHKPTDRPVLPLPTHSRSRSQPLVFKPPHTTTLFPRAPKTLHSTVDDTRKHRA